MELETAVDAGTRRRAGITFTYSSYIEMVLSLQVLCDPGRHGVLLPWVVRFKEKISPDSYDNIFAYGESLGSWAEAIQPVLERDGLTDLSVPSVLHELEEWSGEGFAEAFSQDEEQWSGFLRFLWAYWTDYFHEEFYWIEPLLVGSIRQQTGEARKAGAAFLATAMPSAWEQLDGRLEYGSTVRLLPSVFAVYDRVLSETDQMVTACYPVSPGIYRRPESLTPPEPLARLLKTLADETRLKLLKLMLEEHKCTKELAEELGLAEPTVSRHLRLLRDAELVEGTEDGNFIYYTAKLERIAELHMKVLDFLRS